MADKGANARQFGQNGRERQSLKDKQYQARKEYKGAIAAAYDQTHLDGEVHWEWPDDCEAWDLPEVQKMLGGLNMHVLTAAGCELGIKDANNGISCEITSAELFCEET